MPFPIIFFFSFSPASIEERLEGRERRGR